MLLFIGLAASAITLTSPDTSIRWQVSTDGAQYSVSRKGETIVAPSALGLTLSKAAPFSPFSTVKIRRESRSETYRLIATKAASERVTYNQLVVTYHETSGLRRQISLQVRAYNDGIAFRYILPHGAPSAIKGEATEFLFPNDASCEISELNGSHEVNWSRQKVSQLTAGKLYDVPAVCESESGRTHFAIAQSDLVGYTCSSLTPDGYGLKSISPHFQIIRMSRYGPPTGLPAPGA